jgi:hypothetical protein
MDTSQNREWMEARGVERLGLPLPQVAVLDYRPVAAREGAGPTPDYRAWMEAQGVARLDRVSCEDFPYYRLRAHREDGVYALTVLQPQAGGPTFEVVLQRLAEAIALGPASPMDGIACEAVRKMFACMAGPARLSESLPPRPPRSARRACAGPRAPAARGADRRRAVALPHGGRRR